MSDGYPGERVRVGKEGRKGAKNLEPMDWPTRQQKAPQGEPYGA